MNILYITNHLNVGGITSYVLTLAKGLRQKGHRVYIASSGGELLAKFQQEGIIFIPIPMKTKKELSPQLIFSAFKLARAVKENKIDLIHAQSRTTQVLAFLLHRLTGASYIFTGHGFFKRRFLRRIFPCWPPKVIAISQQVKEHFIKDFYLEDKDICVINNGIDITRFHRRDPQIKMQVKKSLGLEAEVPVVGIIARLSEVKGHLYLVQAMAVVFKEQPQARLLIVGQGKKVYAKLMRLARDLGIAEKIIFVPEISDTADILPAIDIFVMPSLQEGLGLALMEAMASAIAVIGSAVGGIKTLIQDGENGLLVAPRAVQPLARAISRLLNDPLKRLDLGCQAQIFIQQNFPQDKMVLETEREYLRCLGVKG